MSIEQFPAEVLERMFSRHEEMCVDVHELLVDKQVIDTSISCGILPRQDVST